MTVKQKLFLIIVLYISIGSYSQIHIKAITTTLDGSEEIDLANDKDIEVASTVKVLNTITIKCPDLPANHKLTISAANETKEYTTANSEVTINFANNIVGKEVTIKHFDATPKEIASDAIKFRIVQAAEIDEDTDDGEDSDKILESIDTFLEQNYSGFEATPFGYLDPNDKGNRVHIFFDYLGNSLRSTIPQGISNAQYTVHIIYPFQLSNPNKISYSVKQKSGSFSSALLFNNTGIKKDVGSLQGGEKFDGITERKFILGTATDDLTFDIIAGTKDSKITKTVLDTYTIKMSPTYHGSFDVGLLKTELSNPSFNLVQLPGSTDQVVKLTNDSPKGVVTIMASFYVSPIILLESIFGKKVPNYKMVGRNFLDDHKIYERFYPTIGIGVSEKSFENIFYGINWEIARGLSVFGGWHYGKVNTFEMPNYEAGVTPVTPEQFEFYKNTRWKTSTAIGIKLDMLIIRNLFGLATAP